MKKIISCLLVVMMLFTVAAVSAEEAEQEADESRKILEKFLDETDLQKKDLALQVQSGDQTADLIIRFDRETLHLVSRENGKESSHIQVNPTGVYIGSNGNVVLLRFATMTALIQDIVNTVDSMLEEIAKSIPAEALPTQAEIQSAFRKLAVLTAAAQERELADATTLASAAAAFADKFEPDEIIEVKEEESSVQISLRSEAFANALAEALDEMMINPALAELVDRQAAASGGKTFAEYQKEWAENREDVLASVRSIKDTEVIGEDGHLVSHFQIGEEGSAEKILVFDVDTWIDIEGDEAEIQASMGFKDEDPILVQELAIGPDSYSQKLSAGESFAEVRATFEEDRMTRGDVLAMIEGKEEMRTIFSPDYLYVKGPKGSLTASARETWTGKTRFELEVESAEGTISTIIVDFYEENDSLVCELHSSDSEDAAKFSISRIDKTDIDDLSASENIIEITVEKIKEEMENLLKPFIKTDK